MLHLKVHFENHQTQGILLKKKVRNGTVGEVDHEKFWGCLCVCVCVKERSCEQKAPGLCNKPDKLGGATWQD